MIYLMIEKKISSLKNHMTRKSEKKVRRYIKTVLKNLELDGARFLI